MNGTIIMSAPAALYSRGKGVEGQSQRIFKGTLSECAAICKSTPKLMAAGCYIEVLDDTGRRFETSEIVDLLF